MHCHLVIPALLPASDSVEEFLAGATAPGLVRLLSRAQGVEPLLDSYEAWWCSRFGVAKQKNWPLAPIAFAADGGEPGDTYWLHADPAHLQVNRDQLLLADSSQFEISADEAGQLVAALNAHFGEEGLAFHAPRPEHWYLRVPGSPDLCCTSLMEATGKSIHPLLPHGADAASFRSLFNEAQMLLFAHPVNEQREAAGELMVNSVWLWGGGRMPALQAPLLTGLWCSESVGRSFGLAAKTACAELPGDAPSWLSQAGSSGEHLIVLDYLLAARQYGDSAAWRERLAAIDRDWIVPLTGALQAGKISQLSVTGFGDEKGIGAAVTASDLWKFWRGSHSLASRLQT